MPWSGGSFTRTNGVNTGATLWAQDRDDGTKILATRHDTNDQDMADGINSTLEKSGSNAATGNLNIGSNRLTAVADGTAKTDAATVNQIQSNGPAFQATDTGTANAYVVALTPAITAYAAGQRITFKAGAASTTASTLNVNTLGTKALKKLHDQDIEAGDIESGSIVTAVYDGTNFQVTSQLASAGGGTPGGSNTQVQYNSSDTFAGDADLTFDGTELTAAGVNLAAFSGVLEANANFVDQVIFGPSVDGMAWSGLWSKASVFSSLMLATVEDAGADSQINIWDLTTKANTTPLGTVTLSGDATPTSIAAAMGYLIVGSEDGISIIDPHSGAWAERVDGWPRTLSTSTVPALNDNNVQAVSTGFSRQPAYDPRTGGYLPTFCGNYGAGSDNNFLMHNDGTVETFGGTAVANKAGVIMNGRVFWMVNANDVYYSEPLELKDAANSPNLALRAASYPYGLVPVNKLAAAPNFLASASTSGLTTAIFDPRATEASLTSVITRAYNTGFMPGDIRGAWIANSKTVDRSYKANTLTENGTVTEGAVESGAELNGYSGFSTSNYLSRAADADWASFGNGNVYVSVWFKTSGNSSFEEYVTLRKASPPVRIDIYMEASGVVGFEAFGDVGERNINSTGTYDDGAWHKLDGVQISNTERLLYVDGVHVGTDTADSGSLTGSDIILGIGARGHDGSVPATSSTLSLARLSATAPTATEIRQMYDAEKGMFVASAECLLQSSSTDAVLDVDVDPLTSKVLVTQTDAITVFDGLVVDSKPTVNSGSSEKGKLWGDLRAEQNSANAYVTAPADDQRQVNEMVRGLANEMPKGVDFSKAKAWVVQTSSGSTAVISASYNIKSVTRYGTGTYKVAFGIPFKVDDTYVSALSGNNYGIVYSQIAASTRFETDMITEHDNGVNYDSAFMGVFFGELENE